MSVCYGLIFVMWCEQAPKPPITVCPPLVAWEREFQSRMAGEIEKLPPNSALAAQARQHIRLREQIRRCTGK